MPLSDLPTELVLDITDQLDDAGMNALARTNSQIYQFLNTYLYRRDVTRLRSRSMTWAIKNGVEATVQQALDAGGHLDPIPESFHIALIDSAFQGDVNTVAALLKLDGINPNFRDLWGNTPLYRACLRERTPVVRQLLARDDIDLNTVLNPVSTPLLTAIETRNMEVINLLLSKDGIDVNLRPEKNMTPLMKAIQLRLMEVVESLFARDDLDFNVVDHKGDHLLLHSMGLGLDKVKLILNRSNVDPDFVGANGYTALITTCLINNFKKDLDLIEFLLDQGIDVNRRDAIDGTTAFCHAVDHCHPKVIKLLLDQDNMDPNLPDNHGHTALFYAVGINPPVVDLLLRTEGINVNARDIYGSTALAHVCTFHWPNYSAVESVRLILSHPDTDPNILDNNGVSALSKVIELRRTWATNWTTRGTNEYLQRIESLLRAAGAR
jgi:ankyrin repeat protein